MVNRIYKTLDDMMVNYNLGSGGIFTVHNSLYLGGLYRVTDVSVIRMEENVYAVRYAYGDSFRVMQGPREKILTQFFVNKLETKAEKILYGR